jgi:hypothetical protein
MPHFGSSAPIKKICPHFLIFFEKLEKICLDPPYVFAQIFGKIFKKHKGGQGKIFLKVSPVA